MLVLGVEYDVLKNLRVSQSRSATPRTSTSQQRGVAEPDEQRPAWRTTFVAGMAKALAKRAKAVMNEVLIFAVLAW